MSLAKIEREMAAAGRGCLGKAADDEPVFILRAQDTFAPKVVEFWAERVAQAAANNGLPDEDATLSKVREARDLARDMRTWQAINFVKVPD